MRNRTTTGGNSNLASIDGFRENEDQCRPTGVPFYEPLGAASRSKTMRTSRCVLLCVFVILPITFSSAGERTAKPPSEQNVFGLPEEAIEQSGALVIAGGGKLSDEIYDEFWRLAGREDARIVLIPSAYDYGSLSRIRARFSGWLEYDLESFDILHTDRPSDSDRASFCEVLEEATGVWIAGGGQQRLIHRYGETRVEKLLRNVLERGGVVGGTSAGAAVMSGLMILEGSQTQAIVDRGFGLTSRLVIDQHFSERGRFPRLLGVLEGHLGHIGLGIDESTAVVLQGNRIRVLGDGKATVCFGPIRKGEGTVVHRLDADEEADVSQLTLDKGIASYELNRR
jgi:cyanophycinase